jgi:hypothetical protein
MAKVIINLSAALLFGAIGAGAASERRLAAAPLAVIFCAFSAYSLYLAVRHYRNR